MNDKINLKVVLIVLKAFALIILVNYLANLIVQ